MHCKTLIRTLILLMLLTTAMTTVSAAAFVTQAAPFQLAARDGVSLDTAVAQVKKQTKGRVLTAETIQREGKAVHRIKVLLPNGSVRVIHVDAE